MITLRHVGHVYPRPDWSFMDQRHPEMNEFIVPLRGKLHLAHEDNDDEILKPGDAVIYCRNAWHSEWSDTHDPADFVFFTFQDDIGSGIRIVHDPERRIARIAGNMDIARWRDKAGELNSLYAEAAFREFLYLESLDEDNEFLITARSFMIQNINTPVTVDVIAEEMNLSKYHFIRTYKKAAGVTPGEDFRRIRIEEAANLIGSTDFPLKEVAEMTGFSNEYHFNRVFKKVMGIPPGEYSKK